MEYLAKIGMKYQVLIECSNKINENNTQGVLLALEVRVDWFDPSILDSE